MATGAKATAHKGQGGAEGQAADHPPVPLPYSAAEKLREATGPVEAKPRSVAPGRDRLGWQIERVEAIDNRLDVHVMWTKRQTDGQVTLVTRDTLQLFGPEGSRAITEAQILATLNDRAEAYILPTYFDPKIRAEESVAHLVGRTGTLADLPEGKK